ncbi:MAG TPA: hypothetical protein PK490_23030, partial [Prosthecobacter sp.]|nr:hypothetical protein [Prosthecobacter sp.]
AWAWLRAAAVSRPVRAARRVCSWRQSRVAFPRQGVLPALEGGYQAWGVAALMRAGEMPGRLMP